MQIGFSCYALNPRVIAAHLAPPATALELLLPAGRLAAAAHLRDEMLVPRRIRPILTILSFPDRVYFDAEGSLVPWPDGVAFIELLGVRLLRVVGVPGGQDEATFTRRVAMHLRTILPYADRNGITLAYENHGEKLPVVQGLLALLDHPRFRILLDCGNGYLSGETPDRVTRALLPHAAYFHIKDVRFGPNGETLPQHCCPVGTGNLDWRDLGRRIMAAVRDPLFVFELPGWSGDAVAGYRDSLAAFRLALSS